VFDVTDANESRLTETTLEWIERQHFTDNDETGDPERFALYASGGVLKMKIYPTPSEARTIKVRLVIPQEELSSTDLTTVLTIPSRAVWTKALFKANEERGSELGRPGSSLFESYREALYAAKSREMTDLDLTSFAE